MSEKTSKKNVVIIAASPRKDGSTCALLRQAEQGLASRGIVPVTVHLNDLVIRDCQNCHGCKTEDNTECVIRDGMQDVYRYMRESDGIILGSPVYFGNVSGLARLWLDRLVPSLGPDMLPRVSGVKTISFIFTQNLPDTTRSEPGLASFMDAVAMTGLAPRDFFIAGDCEAGLKVPVTERKDLMDRAYRIGSRLLD